MEKKRFTWFEKLVFVIYGYFILLGLLGLFGTLFFGGGFNYWAFSVVAVFGTQAYFRKKLTNLIIGVLTLGMSIFWSLEFALMGHKTGYDAFVDIMLGACLISLLMSVILIFSYTRLSFNNE